MAQRGANRGGPDRRALLSGALAAAALAGPARAHYGDPTAPLQPNLTSPNDPAALSEYKAFADLKTRTDDAQRMTAPVRITDAGPFQFLVDTGADRTVLSRELATALQLPPGPMVSVLGVAGSLAVETVRVPWLQVGERRLENVVAPLLPAADLGAAGLLGVDSLRDQQLLLDFKRQRMVIKGGRRFPVDPDEIVVHGKSRFGQLTLVDSWLYGEPVFVILDSGAEGSVGNPTLRRRIQRARTALAATGALAPTADVLSVTGQSMVGDIATLPNLKIGGFAVRNLSIVFADLPPFARWGLQNEPAMLLGVDVLRQFESVAVDYVRREVRFRLPPAAA